MHNTLPKKGRIKRKSGIKVGLRRAHVWMAKPESGQERSTTVKPMTDRCPANFSQSMLASAWHWCIPSRFRILGYYQCPGTILCVGKTTLLCMHLLGSPGG